MPRADAATETDIMSYRSRFVVPTPEAGCSAGRHSAGRNRTGQCQQAQLREAR